MNFEKYLVGGHVYEITRDNLNKYPSLILNNHQYMKQFYDRNRQCYCLARNRSFFELLIFYINHGILSRPNDLPLELYIAELNYYFIDSEFLAELKATHSIPSLSYSTEIHYLPRSIIKKHLWQAIEYNQGLLGVIYRFLFGLICLCSIFIFMYEMIIIRNRNFNYRPRVKSRGFLIENIIALLWLFEFVLRMISAPTFRLCIKSIYFWIDFVNLLNCLAYGLFSLKYNQEQICKIHMMNIFQWIEIFKTLRMFKLGKYHRSIDLLIQSFGEAWTYFLTLSVILTGTSCIFGSMIYTIERTMNPSSKILYPSVGNGVYYVLLAITNVGFEGFLPTTYLGKWIACSAITIGILSIGTVLPMILSAYTRRLLIESKEIIIILV